MKYCSYLLSGVTVLSVFLPQFAAAQTVQHLIGFFNVFVGLMLTVAILLYGTGFIMWCCRLGSWPSYRTDAVKIMEWSVVVMFVLVVLLAIVQFFQNHQQMAAYLVSTVVVLVLLGALFISLTAKEPEKKERK